MVICKECNREFANRKGLSYHVRTHSMVFADYVIKYEHNGVIPLCGCGCGGQTIFFNGKFMFYLAYHQPRKPMSEETKKKISEVQIGKKQTSESNHKRSNSMKAYYQDHPEFREFQSVSFKNRVRTPETNKKISESRIAAFAAGTLTINRDKVSETITNMYIDGSFAWSTGHYVSTKTGKTCQYRSSWELLLMKELDSDVDVIDWRSECMHLQYEFECKIRRYIPDFHVTRTSKQQLVEVKPSRLRITAMNSAKRTAAIKFCELNNWEYVEWEPSKEFK